MVTLAEASTCTRWTSGTDDMSTTTRARRKSIQSAAFSREPVSLRAIAVRVEQISDLFAHANRELDGLHTDLMACCEACTSEAVDTHRNMLEPSRYVQAAEVVDAAAGALAELINMITDGLLHGLPRETKH
jgi:hypothetical protein